MADALLQKETELEEDEGAAAAPPAAGSLVAATPEQLLAEVQAELENERLVKGLDSASTVLSGGTADGARGTAPEQKRLGNRAAAVKTRSKGADSKVQLVPVCRAAPRAPPLHGAVPAVASKVDATRDRAAPHLSETARPVKPLPPPPPSSTSS